MAGPADPPPPPPPPPAPAGAPPPPPAPPPLPAAPPAPPRINNASPADLARVQNTLSPAASNSAIKQIFGNVGDASAAAALEGALGVANLAKSIYKEALRQAEDYQDEIVGKYGDISTQQETYGKSMAKLAFERQNALNQDFLQMEAGGVKLMDVFADADEALRDATDIIGSLPGSTAQFTDELQTQNLSIIQLLKSAAGLSAEQTAAIMKIAKSRGEDTKQMLADIGTFSKTLSDKFGVDTKSVTEKVVEMTTNTSTFGKVSIEAATAAAVKFEALGVTVSDVSDSIGKSFGSFSGAADAAAKMSQVFGVNIDAMQMMTDVNSGPEGMIRSIDTLRESLIGAGVDVSELSAPMRRLIKEMTGISDDATIESLFDPDRISIETDDILDSAKKAAEAQKDPIEALKFMDKDIRKVMRNMSEFSELTKSQALTRVGTMATAAATSFNNFGSATTTTVDSINQLLLLTTPLEEGIKRMSAAGAIGASVLKTGVEGVDQVVKNTVLQSTGKQVSASSPVKYSDMQTLGRGAGSDPGFQAITGYRPDETVLKNEEVEKQLRALQQIQLKQLKEQQTAGSVSAETQAEAAAVQASLATALDDVGLKLDDLRRLADDASAGSGGISLLSEDGIAKMLASLAEPVVAEVKPAEGAVSVPPTVPAALAAPAVVAMTPAIAPAADSAPVQTLSSPALTATAPTAGVTSTTSSTTSAAGPVTARSSVTSTTVGTAAVSSTGSNPSNLNITVILDAGSVASVLAKHTDVAMTT